MSYLFVRSRRGFSASVPLPEHRARIGRAEGVEIRLDDNSVSKIHASISPILGTDRYRVCDEGSKNGLFFGEQRLHEIVVAEGQEFRLGLLVVTIRAGAPASETAGDAVASDSEVPTRGPESIHRDTSSRSQGRARRSRKSRIPVPVISLIVVVAIGLGAVMAFYGADDSELPVPPPGSGAATATPPNSSLPSSSLGTAAASDPAPPPDGIATPSPVAGVVAPTPAGPGRWNALASALDETCGASGCHFSVGSVRFQSGVAKVTEWGRREKNLLALRQLLLRNGSPEARDGKLNVPAFGQRTPHDNAMELALDPEAASELISLYTESERLLPRTVPFELGNWLAVETAHIAQVLRGTTLLRDRRPRAAEFDEALRLSPDALLGQAKRTAEFWRSRGRSAMRGRPGYPASGAFDLPGSLLPWQVPADRLDWSRSVAFAREQAGDLVTHAFQPASPLPESAADTTFRGWWLESLVDPRRPLAPDALIRSLMAATWGIEIEPDVEEMIRAMLATELLPGIPLGDSRVFAVVRPHLVDFLLSSPKCAFPDPKPGQEHLWLQKCARYLWGVALAPGAAAKVGQALGDGRLEPGRVLAEMLNHDRFSPIAVERSVPRQSVAPQAAEADRAALILDVFCEFPVADLFQDPERVPELWRQLPRSRLTFFATDSEPIVNLSRIVLQGAQHSRLVTQVLLPHLGLLDGKKASPRVLLADGLLVPGLRGLADLGGDPRLGSTSKDALEWLRAQLDILPDQSTLPNKSAVDALFGTGGFLLSQGRWELRSYSPATRMLMMAGTLFDAGAKSLSCVCNLRTPPGGGRRWSELMDALALVGQGRSINVDLWLWGGSPSGGTDAVRVEMGPSHSEGWVVRESQLARQFHPFFRPGQRQEER